MLPQGGKVNIYTDSTYVFTIVHAHGALWRERIGNFYIPLRKINCALPRGSVGWSIVAPWLSWLEHCRTRLWVDWVRAHT